MTAISEEVAAVIDHINALRDEMQVLYDEYTKLAQFLRDKIVELGQNLSDYAKKLQEEVSENSQAIVKLETRYLLGEIGAQQYYSERQSLNQSIQRSLTGLDEVKNMLAVLGQIEVKPLSSSMLSNSEIGLPATSPTPLTGAVADNKVSYEAPEGLVQESSPNPLSETGESAPQPTGVENVDTPVVQETNKEDHVEVSKVEVPKVTIVQSPRETEGSPVSAPQESVAPQHISYSSTENIKALPEAPVEPKYLPPTSDVQPQEASVEAETPLKPEEGRQAYLEGSHVEVVRSVKLMPYAAFYDVSCPKCGVEVPRPMKSWELKGGKSKKTIMIGLFECPGCRVKFREALSKETV